jgi:hypothetical protein
LPSIGGGNNRSNGFEVKTMNSRNPTAIIACTDRTRAFSVGGRLAPKSAIIAPNRARMNTQSSIDPS